MTTLQLPISADEVAAGSGVYAIVSPINANGRGPANQTVVSTASS